MKVFRYFLFVVLISHAFSSAFSQQPLFKSFDIRSENTRPRILKLFLDSNGKIWCGTDQGVFTFDGINFTKIYSTDSSTSIVSAFFEDNVSRIWAGFENGKIVIIKNKTTTVFNTTEGVLKAGISAFAQDNENKIYFSTKGEGVYCLDGARIYNINHDDGLSDDYCYSMIVLPGNQICVGTDAGLNFISVHDGKKTIKTLGTSEGLPDDIVRTLVFDNKNTIWIGLQDKGIARFDLDKNKLIPVTLKNPWDLGQINSIMPADNKLWITTEDKGVIIIDRNGNRSSLSLDGNRNIKANDLLTDHENNIWVAEAIHLYRTSGNKISYLHNIGVKQLKFIHCIVADKKGDIWFSPDQQLGHIYKSPDGQLKYEEYKVLNEKKIDIFSLYFDPYGYLWIGTLGAGVIRFNTITGHVRKISDLTDPASSSILSINGFGDAVWIAGFNSVNLFKITKKGNDDNAVIIRQSDFDTTRILEDFIYSVFIDTKGNAWLGTDGHGIYKYDGNVLSNFPVADNAVHSITEDKRGRMWFSTADAGLLFIDTDNTIHKFQAKEGLSDPSPSSILCTREGTIVIVHENGFDVLNPETGNIIYHSSEENLSDINPDLNSITLSPDSTVWIGTEKGIICYKPSADMKIEKPQVILQTVSVFLNPVDYSNRKIFDADENNLRFDYNGLWYSDPQRVNFQYKMDGLSSKWEKTKDQTITFPKLPAGKFTFRIKASLNDNFDKAEETTYSFEILPPIWQRWWFRLITAAAIALIILFIVRRREARLRKFDRLQKEKIEFQFETLKSQVNPHFLFNSFNTLISVIENSPKQAVEYVERLSEFFRNLVNYRDKNLISVREELSLLNNYLFIQKKRFGTNLILEIELDQNIRNNKSIPPMTLQLLAENAIKHNAVSKETPLIIKITSTKNHLTISNNLNAKIKEESSAGFGLHNIRSMYQLLSDEKIEILKTENNFTVIIPLL